MRAQSECDGEIADFSVGGVCHYHICAPMHGILDSLSRRPKGENGTEGPTTLRSLLARRTGSTPRAISEVGL